jgi:hypothetical protein
VRRSGRSKRYCGRYADPFGEACGARSRRLRPQKAALLAVPLLVVIAALFFTGGQGQARTGIYRLVILRVSYKNSSTHVWTVNQFTTAAREIHDYFDRLSYGHLNMQVTVADVPLVSQSQTREFYWNECAKSGETRNPCPPPLIEDAAEAAASSVRGVDGILVVSPWCAGDYTNGPIAIARPGVNGTFQRSYDFECPLPANLPEPGASGVAWNGWAHEIGHQLQLADGTVLGGNWNGHPSSYASGYELMDSCYPCGESLYGLTGPPIMNGQKRAFTGFLDTTRVQVINAPASGSSGVTTTLVPLGTQPGSTGFSSAPAALKIPLNADGSHYYDVTGRSNAGADAYGTGPGLWDQGIRIREVDESADPPVTNIESCDYTVAGGCVHDSKTDMRAGNCNSNPPAQHRGDIPDYCWPYPLWHQGQAYDDAANEVKIRVDAISTENLFNPTITGFTITVLRGPQRRDQPDVFTRPAYSAPLFAFETTDLWVDSSCNGYVHRFVRTSLQGGVADFGVGPKGLEYGQRLDGTGVGNGDDVCLDHENRVYVRLRDIGDQTARNIRVHVRAQLFPGASLPSVDLGLLGSIGGSPLFQPSQIGVATLSSLAPGRHADVFVPWKPKSPPNAPVFGRLQIPFSLVSDVDTVAGEVVTSNQHSEESIAYFQVTGSRLLHGFIKTSGFIGIANRFSDKPTRDFSLTAPTQLVKGGTLRIANGRADLALAPGQIRLLPVRLRTPATQPLGRTQFLPITLGTVIQVTNPAIPATSPQPQTHNAYRVVGAATLAVLRVAPTVLTLKAHRLGSAVVASGRLTPKGRHYLVIDWIQNGRRHSRLVRTKSDGHFRTSVKAKTGRLRLRAFWLGDRTHARTTSHVVLVR